MKKTWTC